MACHSCHGRRIGIRCRARTAIGPSTLRCLSEASQPSQRSPTRLGDLDPRCQRNRVHRQGSRPMGYINPLVRPLPRPGSFSLVTSCPLRSSLTRKTPLPPSACVHIHTDHTITYNRPVCSQPAHHVHKVRLVPLVLFECSHTTSAAHLAPKSLLCALCTAAGQEPRRHLPPPKLHVFPARSRERGQGNARVTFLSVQASLMLRVQLKKSLSKTAASHPPSAYVAPSPVRLSHALQSFPVG
jgi:hypothetical protein